MPKLLHLWFVLLIYMGLSFIKGSYPHGSLPFLKTWFCGIMVVLWLSDGSSQKIYNDLRKYVLVGSMKTSWNNYGGQLTQNNICIIF